jgi:hypothetical protein
VASATAVRNARLEVGLASDIKLTVATSKVSRERSATAFVNGAIGNQARQPAVTDQPVASINFRGASADANRVGVNARFAASLSPWIDPFP